MEKEIQELQHEIEQIKARNKRVERDKAWETSNTRKIIIAVLTYLVMSLFMISIGVQNPFINALVPTLGFTLSTISLEIMKDWWEKKRK